MPDNDITGQKFNKFTAIKRAGKDKTGRALWLCQCDCGNMVTVNITDLRTGRRKSCGCLQKERYKIFIYFALIMPEIMRIILNGRRRE